MRLVRGMYVRKTRRAVADCAGSFCRASACHWRTEPGEVVMPALTWALFPCFTIMVTT